MRQARSTVNLTHPSITRLRELVAAESACCSVVDWRFEEDHSDLRLVVTGAPEQLDVLGIT